MFWEDDSEPHARSGKLGSRRGLRNKQREKKRKKKINKKEEDLGLTGLISLKKKKRRGLRKLFKCQGMNTEIVSQGGVERLDSRIGAGEDLLNLVSEPQQWFRDVPVHRCIPHTLDVRITADKHLNA